jgi:hypothetical protein
MTNIRGFTPRERLATIAVSIENEEARIEQARKLIQQLNQTRFEIESLIEKEEAE